MMAQVTDSEAAFFEHLNNAISTHIQQAVEGAVEKAMADIEQEVRIKLGGIVLSLAKNYSVQNNGREIIIKVQNEVK